MIGDSPPVTVMGSGWHGSFTRLIGDARHHLRLCSPFISEQGVQAVIEARSNTAARCETCILLTDLSPAAVCTGATQPEAILRLNGLAAEVRIVHLPRLHAKVYIADHSRAIVTSGNLTGGGLDRNHEYGVEIHATDVVARIDADISDYAELGAEIADDVLIRYCEQAIDARQAYQDQIESTATSIQRKLDHAMRGAFDTLIRARLAGGPLHRVFGDTIVYLLRKHGPLSTERLHPLIQRIHPDLCDDTVDRVIDGRRFGKKWKHAVRTAQQQLKKRNRITLHDGKWVLLEAS